MKKVYTTRYTFSGKEKQTIKDLGWLDFSARMLRSETDPTGWLSIDPLCEKYYSISPYVYCNNNPLKYVDPNGMDWIVADGTYNYQWKDDINAKSTMPEGYMYVGANAADIINHMGLNYKFQELSTNDFGMVAMDAELGRYAVSHWVNVKEKSNVNITANISYKRDDATENNALGITFNGISVGVTEISSNSGVDGDMMSGGQVSVQYGDKTYNSVLKALEGTNFREAGTTVGVSTVSIPKSDLSVNSKFSQIQVKGNWFVQKPEGRTPVVRHALVPYPISFKHTWTFKK
ncbi:MAG: hypothetical protein LBK94_07435 [Prevotellaceae bacterium]|jgi:RHS repeat-associated protein|nr:hypothetical protein [Prevotellaceae bacterium]